MADKAATDRAAMARQLPGWTQMEKDEQEQLIFQIIKAIAEWKPIPEVLLKPLPTQALQSLLEMVEQLKAEGLAGPRNRTSDRVKRLMQMLHKRGLIPEREPTADQVLQQQEPEFRNRVLAQESLAVREAEANAALEAQAALARMNR